MMKVFSKNPILVAILMVAVIFSQAFVSFAANNEVSSSEYKTEAQWQEAHDQNPVHMLLASKNRPDG